MGGNANLVKVGFFAIVGALLLAIAITTVRGGDLASLLPGGNNYGVDVVFSGDAVGLQKGMPVKLKGTDVGYLSSTHFTEKNQDVIAELRIDKDVRIYRESTVELREEGLLGERFLAFIYPDQLPESPLWAEDGHVFQGSTATGLAALIRTANSVLESLNTILTDESLRTSMTRIADGMTESLERVNLIMDNVNGIMLENEGYVNESMANLAAISDNFLLVSQDMQETSTAVRDLATDPKNTEQLHRIMDSIESSSASLDTLTANVNSLLGDPMVQADIKDSLRLLPGILEETKATMSGAQDTLENLNVLIESADGMVNTATWAIEDVSGTVQGITSAGAGIQTRGSINVRGVDSNTDDSLGGEDVYVGDANFAVGNADNYVQVGIDNIGEGDDFNLMLGMGDLSGFSFRGGIYRSELGLGASWWDQSGAGAEITWFDLNDPRLNGYGHIPVGDSVNVVLGVEDMTDEAVPTLGVGVKF